MGARGGAAGSASRWPLRCVVRSARLGGEVAPSDAGCDLRKFRRRSRQYRCNSSRSPACAAIRPAFHRGALPPSATSHPDRKNVTAGRIWWRHFQQAGADSWPPHEHAAMLEEAICISICPALLGPAACLHRSAEAGTGGGGEEGDVVVMPEGYHPTWAPAARSVSCDDGGAPGSGGPAVRRGQRATGVAERGSGWKRRTARSESA